ncbi:hypothetical protein CCR95_23130 [Thiocystis minor]|uniref:hypothetical protein n=1 Tax=Thiocystis minor TaxID=61597 RepID=UPI001913180A|nr:hypothetical protein [Thiocystis minor]MBK5966882.1 hypothetical protein [Thiocystis minor]
MDHARAQNIVANLRKTMATRDFDQISETFDALLQLDADAINARAEQVIEQTDIAGMARGLEGRGSALSSEDGHLLRQYARLPVREVPGWIRPVLANAAEAFGAVKGKPTVVPS